MSFHRKRIETGRLGLLGTLLISGLVHAEVPFLALPDIPAAVAKAHGSGADAHLCSLHVYSKDTDVNGSNLRAAPDIKAPILGVIPGKRAEAGTRIGPEFQVIGSKNGWLLIRNAYWAGYDHDEKLLFSGPAWISAGLVGFEAEDPWVREAPRADARKIEKPLGSDIVIKRVHGCSGSFVDVDYEIRNGPKGRGWVSGICGVQVTTCGGGFPYVEEIDGKLVRTGSPDSE